MIYQETRKEYLGYAR